MTDRHTGPDLCRRSFSLCAYRSYVRQRRRLGARIVHQLTERLRPSLDSTKSSKSFKHVENTLITSLN